MKLPVDLFVQGISERKIYYFSSDQINSLEKHHFVCIKRTEEDILILSCCTSQFETVKRFVESRSLPYETLVYIPPNGEDTPFVLQTFINCNQYFTYTIDEFVSMYESGSISHSGIIPEGIYSQIMVGVQRSPLIDNETKAIIATVNCL